MNVEGASDFVHYTLSCFVLKHENTEILCAYCCAPLCELIFHWFAISLGCHYWKCWSYCLCRIFSPHWAYIKEHAENWSCILQLTQFFKSKHSLSTVICLTVFLDSLSLFSILCSNLLTMTPRHTFIILAMLLLGKVLLPAKTSSITFNVSHPSGKLFLFVWFLLSTRKTTHEESRCWLMIQPISSFKDDIT